MSLLVCGINHHTAPLHLREKLALTPQDVKNALLKLMQLPFVNEAMILSTCNRVEIYGETAEPQTVQNWLRQFLGMELDVYGYAYQEKQAVSHIMRVASGLDSMQVGEPQILGQMKNAFSLAIEIGTIGSQFQRLFQTVFNVTKHVRTDTAIGANPITLGYAAVTLAKRIFSDLSKRQVLLIGAGEMIELTALHLCSQGVKHFVVANRSSSKAKELAKQVNGHGITLTDIPVYLKESDIVISATGSELPILGKGAVETAIKARKHRPIFMVDLAVPRDIEPEIAAFEDVYLYNIDDLNVIINENHQCRQACAEEAESIIELQASYFIKNVQSLEANRLITDYREQLALLCEKDLGKALQRIDQGHDPKTVLKQFAHSLTNKVSHSPCKQMKKAAFDGRHELLVLARQLLDL